MNPALGEDAETYNPWTVVNLVFTHLAEEGLHPVLGRAATPASPREHCWRRWGIQPAAEGNREIRRDVYAQLAQIRAVMFEES